MHGFYKHQKKQLLKYRPLKYRWLKENGIETRHVFDRVAASFGFGETFENANLEIPASAVRLVPHGEMVVSVHQCQMMEYVMVRGLGNTCRGSRLPIQESRLKGQSHEKVGEVRA
jgi:hypothetical protein